MILRLVYSFFFLSLVTGNQRLEDSTKTTSTDDCQNTICVCQDPIASPLNLVHSKITENPLRMVERHYGYPTHGLISTPQSRIDTKSFNMDFVSDEGPTLQVPRPIQYVKEDTGYTEKTICFTPSMVHRMIKAALEYISQMPSDINNVIEKLDQELNRMGDQDIIEENAVKRPLYPLDSKTIFKMLDKPRSKMRTNVILKYELPSVKEPICREALEKLIEIAYTAYMELEQHPQCMDYLYSFAAHQPDDRHDRGPDLKALITSILDQVGTPKPNIDISPENDRYGDIGTPDLPVPQTYESNIPQVHDYNVPKKPVVEYIPQKYMAPEDPDYNANQPQESMKPDMPAYDQPVNEYNINDYKVPKIPEYSSKPYNLPQVNEYNVQPTHEFIIPKINDFSVPQNQDYIVPKVHEYTITPNHEYGVPKVHEYSIPKTPEYNVPQVQSIDLPTIHDTNPETIEEPIPMKPEETINILIKLLQQGGNPDSGNLFDRVMNIVQENQNNFQPKILKLILTLLSVHKQNNIPKLNDILVILFDSQIKKDWPWSERVKEHLLSYLIPDQTGNLDPRIVEIIVNLYKKRPNENHVEYILSLLRPLKEGNLDPSIGDIILKLIHIQLNNLLRPDYIDILNKLLRPSPNGIGGSPKEIDIINDLSRWDEIGISPYQVDGIFAILKPYVNGQTDRRIIDIIHFLLTKRAHMNPKHLDFMLTFLYPEKGILNARRVDIIHFLLNNVTRYPKQAKILLKLLQDNVPGVLTSKFLEILLFLNSNGLLSPELVETIVNILGNELAGHLEDNQVKTLFFLLAPFKQSNPKLVVDVLTLLKQGGLHGNIVKWLENTPNNVGLPSRDSKPPNLKLLVEEKDDPEYRIPGADGGYQIMEGGKKRPDYDFMSIFKWLDSQGLITPDQGSNTDLVNKILNILEVGQRELGVVELTYMLKHEKPLIYQPVYYVKYRLPILSFISNMKSLLMENPNLNADPMKLLQELIIVSNVTEVSPNLQGYPKEEILKLTFNDGDLVQAKILDEQNLSLNDQITYVHGLNSDISPEEILQLNKMNEAKYFPKLLEIKGVHPDKLTAKEVDKFVNIPPVQYSYGDQNLGGMHITKKIHQTYFARASQKQDPLHNNNAQPWSQN